MISKFLTLMAVLVSSICLANEAYIPLDNEVMDKIEANKNTCVAGYTENRIYLHSDRIVPTERGMYLNLNDKDFVLLPSVSSDSNGCYLPCVQIFNICPGCGNQYFISCSRRDCPLVQKNIEKEKEKERQKEERKKEKEKKKK